MECIYCGEEVDLFKPDKLVPTMIICGNCGTIWLPYNDKDFIPWEDGCGIFLVSQKKFWVFSSGSCFDNN